MLDEISDCRKSHVLEWTVNRKDPATGDVADHTFDLRIEQSSKNQFLKHIESIVHEYALLQ